ncbi:MAG: lipoate--protein ligase family protein [Chloroflexi bacterium]|nr:lipoate--protein ligase family protein [Chloroflexota bacterium]
MRWRLLLDGPAPGAHNMAVDEAIGRAISEGAAQPTLRFYDWHPPCVSLGRHQPWSAIDSVRCAALGYDIVRRPTGGRALLHTDELTYSIIAPADHPLVVGMVMDAYLRLSRGLLGGLARLGITAQAAPGAPRADQEASAACFQAPSAYEIVVDGRKLLGSAQNRRSGFVLQHGSLPLAGDVTRVVDCLAFESPTERDALRSSLAGHATTVEQLLARAVSFAHAAQAMIAGFTDALHLDLSPGDLSSAERDWAAQLVLERYGNLDWTRRV